MACHQADAAEQAAWRSSGKRPTCPQRHLLGPAIRGTLARSAGSFWPLHWSAPLGVDRYEAVQLAICRACSSSKLTGLLYPSAEWRRLALSTSSMKRGKEAATSSKASYSIR